MQFTPKTEEEIALGGLLHDGLYAYRVTKSEDKVSNAGNEYVALTLDVFDKDCGRHLVFTNLAMIKLLKHFCDVNGMQEQYKSGNIPAHEFMGKSGGMVHIGIEPEKVNPNGGMYRAKNIVVDYVIDEVGAGKQIHDKLLASSSSETFVDSEIPF